ncbi:SDR family oxidoreductase [Sphingomonas piscis]|uniref:SDR family oxidoreductase n=1 Tax=Sphingomonas piscis TaxID=2714943 RepID=A0A6G7YNW0_9SPHN|nr:SDR family oxidoreductase [Sphingomonas piscis]QIK78417.1 SDR family oxidoreductase [Sphingomonas piscis]
MNILITGASRGIGAAAFSLLSKAGHRVVGHSSKGGGDLVAGDLTDPSAPRRIFEEAAGRLGSIDVLINNAGIFEGIAYDASDADWHAAWQRTLTVNLQAAADLSRLAIQHFLKGGRGGRIVNVSSRAAHRGDSPAHWHYAASKGAMQAMTKSIARGYADKGIYIYAVAPGFVHTEMTDEFLASEAAKPVLADIPLGRVAGSDEIAETIRWLACDAPPSATGTTIDVNGASYVR